MPTNTIYLKSVTEKLKGKRVIATDFTEDRDGERILPEGVSLSNFLTNPIMLFAHDHRQLPIGVAEDVRLENGKLTFEPKFTDATQHARDVKALWDDDVLRAVSIGFIPKKREGNVWIETELIEISVVNVPSNPNALAQAKAKGLNLDILKKAATGSPNLDVFPEGKSWDGDTAVAAMKKRAGGPDKENMDWDKYAEGFAYHDVDDEENFTAYKLPFATVDEEGNLKAVWRGVATAMAALHGARGGMDLPDDAMMRTHNLLAGYYKKFDKEPPELKRLSEYTAKGVYELYQKGSILAEDAIEFVASHLDKQPERKQEVEKAVADETQPEVEQPTAITDAEKRLADALHLVVQTINKQTNFALKTVNDVRRKQQG